MSAPTAPSCAARGRAATLLLALVASLACSSATPDRYQRLRGAWQRSSGASDVRAPDTDAPLFAGVAVLERSELVSRVLERNPNLRAARFAWRAALERYPQVSALEDPMLAFGVAPRSFRSDTVDSAAKYDLTQKLPFPGKLRLRGASALGEAEAAGHDFGALRLELATLASKLYDDYALARRSLAINAEHVALLEDFQRIATALYETGEASQQDPIQAEVELTHALHREIVLETSHRVAMERLNTLLHRSPAAPLPPPRALNGEVSARDGALDAPDLLASGVKRAALDGALAERPELAAAAARVAAEQARVALARREYLPDFTLVGTFNGVHQESDLQPFVGLQLNVPLQLGRRRAALDEAEARLERARAQRLALEDAVRFDVHSGTDRLTEARHVAELFRSRLLPAARDQVEAARAGFETGRNSFLALIDAERNLRNVELGHAEALADLGRRRAELDRALGKLPGLQW